MTDPETFWSLLHNAAHWEFEIFLMVVFDGIVGALLYPWASKHIKHHLLRDQEGTHLRWNCADGRIVVQLACE